MRTVPAVALTLLLATSVAACAEDNPAVCDSTAQLKSSLTDLRGIKVTSAGALDDLGEKLATISAELDDVKADASTEYAGQADAVRSSLDALRASARDAAAKPSSGSLAALGSALSSFTGAVRSFVADVETTC